MPGPRGSLLFQPAAEAVTAAALAAMPAQKHALPSLADIAAWRRNAAAAAADAAAAIDEESAAQAANEAEALAAREGGCTGVAERRGAAYTALADAVGKTSASWLAKALNASAATAGVLETVSCVAGNVPLSFAPNSDPTAVARVRAHFANMKLFASGAYGVTMSPNFSLHDSDGRELFIVKAPMRPGTASARDGTHEAFLGFNVFNPLRSGAVVEGRVYAPVPNFMYTYAAFSCSPPIVEKDAGAAAVATWCATKFTGADASLNVVYNVVEKLAGRSIIDSVEKADRRDLLEVCSLVLSAIAQVTAATAIAHDAFQYTHYDLHAGNVIMRPVTRHTLGYTLPGGESLSIAATSAATIIDFGMSFAVVDGRAYGTMGPNHLQYGVLRTRSNPVMDLFKLTASALTATFAGRRLCDAETRLQKLLSPFVHNVPEFLAAPTDYNSFLPQPPVIDHSRIFDTINQVAASLSLPPVIARPAAAGAFFPATGAGDDVFQDVIGRDPGSHQKMPRPPSAGAFKTMAAIAAAYDAATEFFQGGDATAASAVVADATIDVKAVVAAAAAKIAAAEKAIAAAAAVVPVAPCLVLIPPAPQGTADQIFAALAPAVRRVGVRIAIVAAAIDADIAATREGVLAETVAGTSAAAAAAAARILDLLSTHSRKTHETLRGVVREFVTGLGAPTGDNFQHFADHVGGVDIAQDLVAVSPSILATGVLVPLFEAGVRNWQPPQQS